MDNGTDVRRVKALLTEELAAPSEPAEFDEMWEQLTEEAGAVETDVPLPMEVLRELNLPQRRKLQVAYRSLGSKRASMSLGDVMEALRQVFPDLDALVVGEGGVSEEYVRELVSEKLDGVGEPRPESLQDPDRAQDIWRLMKLLKLRFHEWGKMFAVAARRWHAQTEAASVVRARPEMRTLYGASNRGVGPASRRAPAGPLAPLREALSLVAKDDPDRDELL